MLYRTQPVLAATGTLTSVNALVYLLDSFHIYQLTGPQVAAVNFFLIAVIAPFLRALVTPSGKSARLIEAALSLPPASTMGEVEAKAAVDAAAIDRVMTTIEDEKDTAPLSLPLQGKPDTKD